MRPVDLGALYLLVGAGTAVAALASRARGTTAGDALLLLLLWPLYGPFLLARLAGDPDADGAGPEVDFLVALRRASATPLGGLLPDERTARALGRRLQVAATKVAEIDRLFRRPEFSEDEAVRRREALLERGASEYALSTATLRLQNLRRLRSLRDRFSRELDEVRELLAQLTTQAEVVRLAGAPDASTAELVRELVSRVEGLDQMLDDDPHMLRS